MKRFLLPLLLLLCAAPLFAAEPPPLTELGVTTITVSFSDGRTLTLPARIDGADLSLSAALSFGDLRQFKLVDATLDRAKPKPAPTPPKPAPPKPIEPPAPVVSTIPNGSLVLLLVLPSIKAQTDIQGALSASLKIAADAKAHKNYYLTVDPASAGPSLQPYVTAATADGLPRLLVVDLRNKVVAASIAQSAPVVDEATTLALLKIWEAN